MMPFQKLQAFGLYLSKLNFFLCLLLLGSLKTYIVGIFGNQSMNVGGLRTYLRFLVVHDCHWCSALAMCTHSPCCDSGSCQCTSLISCTKNYYVHEIILFFLEFLVAKFTCADDYLAMLVDATLLRFLNRWKAVWARYYVITISSHYAMFPKSL